MINKNLTLVIMAILVIICGCKKKVDNPNPNPTPIPGNGTYIDHGFIPSSVDASQNYAEFQSAIYNDNHVFVATSDGVWKNNLTTKQWSRAGLDGKGIIAIYKHPTVANKFFAGVKSDNSSTLKTMYISNDGGVTWQAGNNVIFNTADNHYEDYVCFAVRPNNPNHIYANLNGGTTIAVSTDGGLNWVRQNNETASGFGYESNIAFLPNNPDAIFQGSENPMDDAWLGKYDINSTNPVLLSNFSKIINMDTYGNRRPTELQTNSYTGNNIYVGQEGGLSKVNGSSIKYIFKSENSNFPYSYIYAIWVDPNNTNHLLFGGEENGGNAMNLYETYDEGQTIKQFTDKMGFSVPNVREIISTNTYPAVIINEDGGNKAKLYLYKPTN